MAERAHPAVPFFRRSFQLRWILGAIPCPVVSQEPGRELLEWRYRIARRFTGAKRVLDIPCGMGWGTSLLSNASSVIGVDVDSGAVEEAKRRYGRLNFSFQEGDMACLTLPERSFDVVTCLEGIEHVPVSTARMFLKNVRSALVPGGTLIVSSPSPLGCLHSDNPYHIREYRYEELVDLLAAHGFAACLLFTRTVVGLEFSIVVARRVLQGSERTTLPFSWR